MKKIIKLLFTLLIVINLIACQSKQEDVKPNNEEPSNETNQNIDTEEKGKSLVIYFSRDGEQYVVGVIEKGNTEIVAEMIAETIDADLFEVEPKEDNYPKTYNELLDVARNEQSNSARPKYKGELPDLNHYDTIFIGAPVWWGDWPMIMYSIFDDYDFSDKNLVPFTTHEGSGLSGFDSTLANEETGATILEGLAIRGNDAQNNQESVKEEINNWLSKLGY